MSCEYCYQEEPINMTFQSCHLLEIVRSEGSFCVIINPKTCNISNMMLHLQTDDLTNCDINKLVSSVTLIYNGNEVEELRDFVDYIDVDRSTDKYNAHDVQFPLKFVNVSNGNSIRVDNENECRLIIKFGKIPKYSNTSLVYIGFVTCECLKL